MQKNSAQMRLLQPEIERLRGDFDASAKSSIDSAAHQRAMMKLFAEHKINPMASLMPMMAQSPVFISFFWAFTALQQRYPEYALI